VPFLSILTLLGVKPNSPTFLRSTNLTAAYCGAIFRDGYARLKRGNGIGGQAADIHGPSRGRRRSIRPGARRDWLPHFTQKFGNAASRNHSFGLGGLRKQSTRRATSSPRLINAKSKEIIFTSGATRVRQRGDQGGLSSSTRTRANHIITCVTGAQGGARTVAARWRRAGKANRGPTSQWTSTGWSTRTRCANARSPTRPC